MGRATTTAKKTVGYQPRLQKKHSLICLLWAWCTSRPSAGPWLSFSLCTPVHHCHLPAGSLVWVEIPSLNSHSVFAPGSLGEVEVCLQMEPGHSPAAKTAHLSTGNKHFQAFNQHHSITHQVFLLLLSFIYDALIWITVWQKTRGTGGRAAPASARPRNAVAPCCTSWPASSQGEAKERSTWVGWALSFYPLWNRSCCTSFYLPSRRKKMELLRHAVPSISSLNY